MYALDIYNRNLKEPKRYNNPTIAFTTQEFFAKVIVVFEVFRNFGVFLVCSHLFGLFKPIELKRCVIRLSNDTKKVQKFGI